MNIFVLDSDQKKCAIYAADQHLNKMILESAQMLCTALNENGIQAPYRSFNPKHPCNIWVMESLTNWQWLKQHALNLETERHYRFPDSNEHKSISIIISLPEPPISDIGLTPSAQAMPEIYRVNGDAVQAYRNFYIHDKSRFATWTRRSPPEWYLEAVQ